MAKHIETFKGWAETFRTDVAALKALVEEKGADMEARKLAVGALSYLVTRMDLVPDWNEGIGMMDDIMVVRVCAQMASHHKLGALEASAELAIGRMANEAEKITDFLGADLYDKLRQYCAKLEETAVRGRTPQLVISEGAARLALYTEVDDEIKRSVPIVVADPDDAELRLKSYLAQKL
ncbi:MAG: DUF1232 domain-containing protein [Deltaproteobacteria bacterium]|nr:DUF1232 domain-containing protein [Deltaproteobacteria bacterium]